MGALALGQYLPALGWFWDRPTIGPPTQGQEGLPQLRFGLLDRFHGIAGDFEGLKRTG
jgi:hypothetical protein